MTNSTLICLLEQIKHISLLGFPAGASKLDVRREELAKNKIGVAFLPSRCHAVILCLCSRQDEEQEDNAPCIASDALNYLQDRLNFEFPAASFVLLYQSFQ